jgi:MoaA/NifB/PqqE/SkfB family radical SAM enzyme
MESFCLNRADVRTLNTRRSWRERRRICHIPEKGLYFGLRGQVFSCCFNKSYVIGTYPENSIQEIWEGSALKQQQRAIKKWDLSLGCQGCHSLIKSQNFNALPLRNYDQYAPRNHGYPAKMDFELFNTCNLECVMCRGEFSSTIRKNREGLPPIESPYDDAFFDQVEKYIPHLKSSHFLGGEPFLIPQYVDLWERMAVLNSKMAVSVQTNCTILNQRTKDLLAQMNFHISVSIDSVDPENYARIRKHGQLARVLENLRYFRDYTRQKGTMLTLAFCPMPQNWHELPAIVDFCNEWQIPLMFTTVESPPECSLSALSFAQLAEIEDALLKVHHPLATPLERQNHQTFQDQILQIRHWKKSAETKESAGIHQKPADFPAFIAQIKALLRLTTKMQNQEVEQTVAEIESKLNYVLRKASEEGREAEALAKMIGTQPELVIRSVPSLTQEALLVLFNSFVMPMN